MRLPIIARCHPRVSQSERDRVKATAESILREQPGLHPERTAFNGCRVTTEVEDAGTLHLDDFSEIPLIGMPDNSAALQQRARLRAVDGDVVVQSRDVDAGYSDYCEYRLGLGRVSWLYPAIASSDPRKIAHECWVDRRLRHELEQAIRHDGVRYLHPHLATEQVWELASLLHRSTRCPLQVLAPTPELAQWANDKIEFTKVVGRLFGDQWVPRTEHAYNFAMLAKHVHRLAAAAKVLCVKFPYGTGGAGNFSFDCEPLRQASLPEVNEHVRQRLGKYQWPSKGRVLVDVWESPVLGSPSVQTWIPPLGVADPVLEGVFDQVIEGEKSHFVGSAPAELPPIVNQQLVDKSFLLALLFQQLGYVGRCSFDLILVGNCLENCRVEFIECNARWGGTSAPMTMMNRLRVLEAGDSYATQRMEVPGLDQFSFRDLERWFGNELYDHQRAEGKYIFFNPGRIRSQSAIEVVALGSSPAGAGEELGRLLESFQRLVRDFRSGHRASQVLLRHADFDLE